MEDLSSKIFAQTSENIQKLFDLSTRIDERVKSIIQRQEELERKINEVVHSTAELRENIAVLKSVHGHFEQNEAKIADLKKETTFLDKRITSVERTSEGTENRWNTIIKFIVQIIWLVVGAWILYKLGLGPPNLP